MGQFSWITQDTFQSIRNNGGDSASSARKRKAFLHDDKGNVWEEKNYEGYGIFGGKDFFQLVAEMNNIEGINGDIDNDRSLGIDLWYSDKPMLSPNLTRSRQWTWENRTPLDCPNQGWSDLKFS